jgi:hypothetical protein
MTPSKQHRSVLFFPASALALASLILLGAGCASRIEKTSAEETAPKSERYSPAMSTELGRVISYDPAAANVIIEFSSFASPPADLSGRALIARNPDTLAPTARLVAAAHRTGRIFGAHVVAGQPAPDDEVVLPPPF